MPGALPLPILLPSSARSLRQLHPLLHPQPSHFFATMSSSSSPSPSSPTSPHPEAEEPGYPDRTFTTQHLPCDPTCTLTFSEAGPSRYTHAPEPYTKAIPLITSPLTRSSLSTAAAHLRSNQLVSFPSETVYGLGANALSQSAVSKIYAAKKRPADNPLIVHVSDLSMLDTLLPATYQLGAAYEALVKAFWPGALTLLFPVDVDKPAVPSVVTCGHASVAVRMPSHPIARALIATSRLPIAGPSANASGRPSPTTAAHVMRDLGGALDSHPNQEAGREHKGRLKYILDGGPCQVGVESTVVDGITAENELRVLRPGGVTVEQIEQVLKEAGLQDILKLSVYGKDMQRSSEQESKPTTPGMKYKHYSPTAPVVKLLSTKLFPSAIARPYHSNATSSTQALNSLINQSPNSTRTTPQTFAKVVREQIASLLTSSNAGTGMINIGLMTTRDSDLSRHIFSSFTASLSVHDSSGESIHRLLLPPRLLIGCEGVMIHPFDLGPCTTTEVYAQRMFDGLRTLDEGPLLGGVGRCHLIFVEALDDAGVGLAVMNRLNKAASATVLLDC